MVFHNIHYFFQYRTNDFFAKYQTGVSQEILFFNLTPVGLCPTDHVLDPQEPLGMGKRNLS
ncbi:MAG: hypothetical protein CR994_02565 [Maribacter sp.]|nr:MAG: hypothetical protein CR994_02565 [Maribacter sp.]